MVMPTGAGDLRERVAFDKRGTGSDGGGGVVTTWAEQFQRRAAYVHRHGGESVMADRLQGTHTLVIRVRADSSTRTISTDWRVRDARTGAVYNIRDVTATVDRMWVDVLAQSGVAT
jgi:SPP1 family predicted phage head-tail adaptor